jgi:hypothetical protein
MSCFVRWRSGAVCGEYLSGLLAPRDRNKTSTCLAGAQHAAVQRLQYSLSEAHWDNEAVDARHQQNRSYSSHSYPCT